MKKMITAVLVSALIWFDAQGAETYDTVFIGQNAGGESVNVDRSVFIGSAAGWKAGGNNNEQGYTITSNLFIGAASALRSYNVGSCVGLGYHAFRGATNCFNCVGIGDSAFAGEYEFENETRINGQLLISPDFFGLKMTPGNLNRWSNDFNETPCDISIENNPNSYDMKTLYINHKIDVEVQGWICSNGIWSYGDIFIQNPAFGYGPRSLNELLDDLHTRLVEIEKRLAITNDYTREVFQSLSNPTNSPPLSGN